MTRRFPPRCEMSLRLARLDHKLARAYPEAECEREKGRLIWTHQDCPL
jgi:hypothetical protein